MQREREREGGREGGVESARLRRVVCNTGLDMQRWGGLVRLVRRRNPARSADGSRVWGRKAGGKMQWRVPRDGAASAFEKKVAATATTVLR